MQKVADNKLQKICFLEENREIKLLFSKNEKVLKSIFPIILKSGISYCKGWFVKIGLLEAYNISEKNQR